MKFLLSLQYWICSIMIKSYFLLEWYSYSESSFIKPYQACNPKTKDDTVQCVESVAPCVCEEVRLETSPPFSSRYLIFTPLGCLISTIIGCSRWSVSMEGAFHQKAFVHLLKFLFLSLVLDGCFDGNPLLIKTDYRSLVLTENHCAVNHSRWRHFNENSLQWMVF